MTYRAEQVLLAVLEARPVSVSDIREALEELRTAQTPAPSVDVVELTRMAKAVVEAHNAWQYAFDNDTGEEDFDPIWDAIVALKLVVQL